MAKSRIKSEAEYNRILGIDEVQEDAKETKVTHDANQYFNELKENKKEVAPDGSNPFEKTMSIQDIKKSLTQGRDENNVESIKKEIASAQTETDLGIDEIDDIVVVPREQDNKKEFSFEENAKKLYENLRGANKVNQSSKAPKLEEIKESVEVVDPISISEQRSTEENIDLVKPEVNPAIENLFGAEMDKLDSVQENDKLDLTADFTKENENFIEAINQQQKEIKTSPVMEKLTVDPVVEEVEDPLVDDIEGQINKQMEQLDGHTGKIEVEQSVPDIEEISLHDLDIQTKRDRKPELQNTLKLALDPEDTAGFSASELKMLNNNEIEKELEKTKRKPMDTVVTIVLIIMIVVVLGLLVYSVFLQK